MGEQIAELGQFLSGIMTTDPIFIRTRREVEGDGVQKTLGIEGEICGFYQSHTARGYYEITVQLSIYNSDFRGELKEERGRALAMISGIEEKVLDALISLTFSEADNSEEALLGFGSLERGIERRYDN